VKGTESARRENGNYGGIGVTTQLVGVESRVAEPGTAGSTANWYAVYTRSRHEKIIHRTLLSRGLESFLPLCRVLSQWKDRRQWVMKPLFPGYLFVNVPQEELSGVCAVRGVVCVVGDGEGAVPVPAGQVEAVRRMLQEGARTDPWPYMEEGRRVRVVCGPLIGMEGFIVERKKKCRLVVSVDLLGRSVATEIEADSVELVR